MQTKQPGATMSFTFEGVFISVYGSKNADHGNYTVNVEGIVEYGSEQGTAAQPVQYQSRIFFTNTLPPGTHTLTILNQHSDVFDIDYISWTSNIDPRKNGTLSRSVVDDTAPAFQYQANAWSTTPSNLSSFYGSTGHTASKLGSTFNFTFAGDAVSLYGSSGPSSGPYSVQLDDQPPKSYVATQTTYTAQTLLFYGSNLTAGTHTLHVVNQANALLEIDYAEIYTLPMFSNGTSVPTQASSSSPSATGLTDNRSSLSVGAIAGISAGAAIAVIALVLLSLCAFLRVTRQKSVRQREESAVKSPFPYTYETPPSSAVLDEATVVSPFRSSKQSKATLESPESPMTEMRKPFAPEPAPIIPPPSMPLNVPMTAHTLVGEDGSNIPSSQRIMRPRRKSKPRSRTPGSTNPLPLPIPQQASTSRNERPPEYSLTPVETIPDPRGPVQYSDRRSRVSESTVPSNPPRPPEDDSDATSDSGGSSFDTHPWAPPPTLLTI